MEYIFALAWFLCQGAMLASLFTSKTVKFLKAPSRGKGVLFWLVASCISFGIMGAFIPEKEQPQLSVQEQTQPPIAPAPVAQQYTLLPYQYEKTEDTSTAKRNRAKVLLNLAVNAEPVTIENLAATCMSAAKHYATVTGAKALSVMIYDQPGINWGHTRIATCDYSSDNGGWSGDQGWTWDNVQAAKRTTTQQEKDVARLWNEMRGKFQKNGSTDEKALSAAIAKQLGTPEKTVTLPYLSSEKVNPEPFLSVPAKGPDKSPVVQPNPTEVTQEPQKVQATTSTTKAVQNTELPWSRKSVIANYNAAASALNLPRVNAENAQHTQDVADAWNYALSPYTNIVLLSNLGSSHITSAIFIGAGDGTQQSGAAVILSAICTVTALTPDATGNQRSALFKKLGLMDGSISDGKDHKVMFGPVKFSASFTTTTGLMITASPVEQKQSPKAQKPSR